MEIPHLVSFRAHGFLLQGVIPPRPETPEIIKACKHAIKNHRVLTPDEQLGLSELKASPGKAEFTIGAKFDETITSVSRAYACWGVNESAAYWKDVERILFEATEGEPRWDWKLKGDEPPAVPWLASIALPMYARLKPEHILILPVAQQHVVWALMEIEKEAQAQN